MNRTSIKTLLFTVFLGMVAVHAAAEDVAANYRLLEWNELVPENWEAPLIPPGHDTSEAFQVPADATVADLNEIRIALPGYIKTAEFEDDQVKALLLVPFLPHHIKHHAHLDANQKVYVSLLQPAVVDNPLEPIWVVGTLSVATTVTEEGPAAYLIADAVITEYEY